MYKYSLSILTIILTSLVGFSQSIWEVNSAQISSQVPKHIIQSEQIVSYKLNKQLLYQKLQKKNKNIEFIRLELPYGNAKAELKTFQIQQVFTIPNQKSKSISKQILSYKGTSVEGNESVRITITPIGLFASIIGPNTRKYINPIGHNYAVLNRSNFNKRGFDCLSENNYKKPIESTPKVIDDSLLRTYDLAVACSGEYAQFHINAANANNATDAVKKDIVLSAMVVTIDRVNQIYENDLAINLQLIPNNRDLIFLDSSTDPYDNFDSNQLINNNTSVINSIIGENSYDLGHVFTTGGGGIAALGSVCSNLKGAGVTGLPNPVGDPFDVDYVAHEIGHQFGATHTYNNSCGNNRTEFTAYEPGSGQTIMAYAGICAPNVANNSVPYFHFASINQISNFVSFGSGSFCVNSQVINNTAPQIEAVNNYTIPKSTPFKYSASATDLENDNLTYTWEQFDNEISTQPPLAFSTGGPNFKYLSPSEDSFRYFPDLNTVLANENSTTWEVLPNVTRNMTFVVTVRDNNMSGGQVSTELSNLTISDAGPFEVTSQNTNSLSYTGNSNIEITWDVAGTNANNINTNEVNILLSTDGGLTFDQILSENTPNDGSEFVDIPNIDASNCRIMIQPVNNIYFAVNTSPFSITKDLSTNDFQAINFKMYPNPSNSFVNLEFGTQLEKIQLKVFNIQGKLVAEKFYKTSSKVILNTEVFGNGVYLVKVEANGTSLIKKLLIN
ncbi:reprolysin-like metallopeptidase [Psychroflexus sp. ALD_RP9]|uniref:reprolysin-like metallopeptidase n=1 Tax=Psychroflexus sp. ALD_RP9 TaxID=2777186 RepID=UPI001A8C8709|nr:zinc-dependent metalloprotease family protein [Psychroflexus sp. ALD_RP9]QSS97421.1 T9SS type A sorting domain-containing protein [Psychroflexus sp. ALD_RP9]